jgi:hypothetical protein
MKAIIAIALFLSLGAAAAAKPDPVTPQDQTPLGSAAAAIVSEPVEAMMESEYFRAPEKSSATERLFPCPLRQMVFGKRRIALACN